MQFSSSWTPTTKVALALLVVAILGVVVYCLCWLQAWMPNVVVGAITVALTITVIEQALQREARQRIQPRVDDALSGIGSALQGLIAAIVIDYAGHHLDNFAPIPADGLEMINLWLSEHDAEDNDPDAPQETARPPLPTGWSYPEPVPEPRFPMLVAEGRDFARRLDRYRDRDREVMTVDLIQAIDNFQSRVNHASLVMAWQWNQPEIRARNARRARHTIIMGARAFAMVFTSRAPKWLEIDELEQEAAADHSAGLRARRDGPTQP